MKTTSARPRPTTRSCWSLFLAISVIAPGCTSTDASSGLASWFQSNPYEQPNAVTSLWTKSEPKDGMVLPGGEAGERTQLDDKARHDLEDAKRLYQEKKYAEAEKTFHLIAKAKKLPVDVQEDALFYRGECQRLQANYRDAEGSLKLYIKSYPYGRYTSQANERLFDIANYWLNPSRERMKRYEDQREGKGSYFVMPAAWFHLSRDMPMNDVEGHALGILEEVRLNDLKGKLAEKSLFYIATVKFFNEDYKDADFYYSQIVDNYPNSDLAAKAMKQSIICKQIANGGTAYDTRLVEKCRAYLEEFHRSYPGKDTEWIQKQLVSINHQQADRDFNIAEFYRRTGHPGSAYFYYEIVRRSYPNTEYARKAEGHMNNLRSRVAEEQRTASADGSGTPVRPWYESLATTFGPTRTVLESDDPGPGPGPAASSPSSPSSAPGLLPNLERR